MVVEGCPGGSQRSRGLSSSPVPLLQCGRGHGRGGVSLRAVGRCHGITWGTPQPPVSAPEQPARCPQWSGWERSQAIMSNQGETGRSHLVALASGPHEDRHVLGTQEVRTVGQVGVSGRLRGPGGGSVLHEPRCLSTLAAQGSPRLGHGRWGEQRGCARAGGVRCSETWGTWLALGSPTTVARVRVKRICRGRAGDRRCGYCHPAATVAEAWPPCPAPSPSRSFRPRRWALACPVPPVQQPHQDPACRPGTTHAHCPPPCLAVLPSLLAWTLVLV